MTAIFSPCGLYRQRLEREVQAEGIVVALVGVNPSYANATKNDPTITKEVGFATINGWRRIIKGNVFDFISTDIKGLKHVRAMSDDNRPHLERIFADADMIVPCWGRRTKLPRELRPQLDATAELIRAQKKPVMIFGLTKTGDPIHPLMLGYATELRPWQ